ncbi:MAG TPA: hypothetical protein VJY63_06955 [Marinospirillum sp.]|uniref:hypothetical protein n=1 Tax=Marinospirillum sp. TaxID=2183934 RepID=UPI002B48D00D|nr:hypothetical protein [Marinospirillum sp.]HKM15643.1 hypothetical protein [Marinospirillum sp.]
MLETRADFVLRPLKQAERSKDNELIIYTDGYEHHGYNLTDDMRKRLSLQRSGRKVWVLTWIDLDSKNLEQSVSAPELLLSCVQPNSRGQGLWEGVAQQHNWRSVAEVRGLLEQGSFAWLCAWLTKPTDTRQELIESALCIAVLQLARNSELEQFVAQSLSSGGAWRESVLADLSSQATSWGAQTDNENPEQSAWQLLSYLAHEDRSSLTTLEPRIHVLLSLNDTIAPKSAANSFAAGQDSSKQANDYKDKWRAIWQAFNVLQYTPSFSVATQTGLQSGLFSELLAHTADLTTDIATNRAMDHAWQEVRELSCLTVEQLQALQGITRSAPEVGIDLQDADGVTIGTAELAWQHLTVAVFLESAEQLPELDGWQCISLESDNWLEQLQLALGEE